MEIKQLVFSTKDSSKTFIFNDKINLVASSSLSDEIIKENYNNLDSEYLIKSEDKISLADVIQVKINLTATGVFMVALKKSTFTKKDKKELFAELVKLRDNNEITVDSQKIKITKIIESLIKYNPLYVAYVDLGNFKFDRKTFIELFESTDLAFPILILNPSQNPVIESSANKKKENNGKKETKLSKKLNKFYTTDFLFFAIFSIFISFGSGLFVYQILNGDAIAIFLAILVLVFVGTLFYATYRSYKESEKFEYKLNKIWLPICYLLLGVLLGFAIALLVTNYVLKPKEGVTINFGLVFGISLPISFILSLSSIATPLLIEKIVNKFKKK